MFVEDLADACLHLMTKYNAEDIGEIVNVGMGEDLRIKDLAQLISEMVGFKGEIRFDRTKSDGTPRKLLDISRMRSLGWSPHVSLREGIQRTYDWYLEEGD